MVIRQVGYPNHLEALADRDPMRAREESPWRTTHEWLSSSTSPPGRAACGVQVESLRRLAGTGGPAPGRARHSRKAVPVTRTPRLPVTEWPWLTGSVQNLKNLDVTHLQAAGPALRRNSLYKSPFPFWPRPRARRRADVTYLVITELRLTTNLFNVSMGAIPCGCAGRTRGLVQILRPH